MTILKNKKIAIKDNAQNEQGQNSEDSEHDLKNSEDSEKK